MNGKTASSSSVFDFGNGQYGVLAELNPVNTEGGGKYCDYFFGPKFCDIPHGVCHTTVQGRRAARTNIDFFTNGTLRVQSRYKTFFHRPRHLPGTRLGRNSFANHVFVRFRFDRSSISIDETTSECRTNAEHTIVGRYRRLMYGKFVQHFFLT